MFCSKNILPLSSLAAALYLLLASSGCGPQSRGTLTLPPPPALRPGHGLPTYNPKTKEVEPERSPHARMLPQTPETRRGPGLWSGETPNASRPGFDPNLGRVTLPHPKHMGAGAQPFEDVEPVMRCAKGMYSVMNDAQRHFFDTARSDTMKCIAAYLYRHCVEKLIDKEERALADASTSAPSAELRRLRAIRAVAASFFTASCTPAVPFGNGDDALVNGIKARWDARPDLREPILP